MGLLLNGIEPTTLLLKAVLRLQFLKSIHRHDLDGVTDLGPEAAHRLLNGQCRSRHPNRWCRGLESAPAVVHGKRSGVQLRTEVSNHAAKI